MSKVFLAIKAQRVLGGTSRPPIERGGVLVEGDEELDLPDSEPGSILTISRVLRPPKVNLRLTEKHSL